MMAFICLALAVLVGLPATKGRLGPATTENTAQHTVKTPRAGPRKRDGATARGGLMSKLQPSTTVDPLLVAGDIELFAACLSAGGPDGARRCYGSRAHGRGRYPAPVGDGIRAPGSWRAYGICMGPHERPCRARGRGGACHLIGPVRRHYCRRMHANLYFFARRSICSRYG